MKVPVFLSTLIFSMGSILVDRNIVQAKNIIQHRIQILNVVTKQPVEGVEIQFSLSHSCYPQDNYIVGYDYKTCNGKYNYEPIENKITDRNGIIYFSTFPKAKSVYPFNFNIIKADGYAKNSNYNILSDKLGCCFKSNN